MEPWFEARTDLASGLVAATLANIHRKEGARPFNALDFAPFLKPREEPEQMDPSQFVKAIKNG